MIPWAVLDARQQPPVFRCARCQDTHPIKLPMDISEFSRAGEDFANRHRHCKPVEPLAADPVKPMEIDPRGLTFGGG